jgi:hypothetical protein
VKLPPCSSPFSSKRLDFSVVLRPLLASHTLFSLFTTPSFASTFLRCGETRAETKWWRSYTTSTIFHD